MKSLQKMKEGGVSIARMVHERLTGVDSFHPHKALHASDLSSIERPFCPREFYLMDMLKVSREPRPLAAAMRMTFDVGIDSQRRLNNQYLRDVMWGHWVCPHCSEEYRYCFDPGPCKVCEHKKLEYREVVAASLPHGIVGSIDAIVKTAMPKLRMVEMKTIDKDACKKLTEPQPEHVLRTNLYLQLIALSKDLKHVVDSDTGHVLYTSKSFGFLTEDYAADMPVEKFSPFKEYKIKRDPEALTEVLGKAECLHKCRVHHRVPARLCESVDEKRAQACPVHQQCFSGQIPQQVTWMTLNGPAHKHLKTA
jgi:hypothetical protein